MTQIIDGKKISAEIKDELKEQVAAYREQGTEICLAVIQVGDDPASCVYVRNKKKACEYIGIKSLSYELPARTTQEELLSLIGFQREWARRLVAGLLELSSGVSSLRDSAQLAGRAAMAAFMLGWAGLSVHCQVLSFLADSGLSARVYLAGKLCHGLIAAALTYGLTRLIPLSAPVSDYLVEQTETIAALDFSTALAVSTLSAFGGWLVLTAMCGVLWRKKYGKARRNRV